MRSKIKWVIQRTLASAKTLDELTSAVAKSGAACELIDVMPFSVELNYESRDSLMPIIYGSNTFILLAYKHKYLSAGVFFDDSKFLMSEYIKHWNSKVLNNDAIIIKAGELDNLEYGNDHLFFVRPNEDTKTLSGSLIKFQDLKIMVNGVLNESPSLTNDTELVLSSPKTIDKEWRNFIVQGKVISSCRYSLYGELSVDEHDVPDCMIRFVEALCEIFTPHDVFVMDVCYRDGDYFVIECNCFNGSGVYNNDLFKIVSAVNAYIER